MTPPTVRVVRIIALMTHQKKMTGQQIADRLGVTTRTVWRDMKALCRAGYPILGISGDGYTWKPRP